MKPIYQSRTTQNVAIGAVSGQAVALTIIQLFRKISPTLIWWTEDQDQTIVQVLGVLLTPFLSRLIAKIRRQLTEVK